MTSEEMIVRYGRLVSHEPTPEEIERAIMDAERRLRAEACRELARAAATWFAHAFRGRELEPAHADSTAKPAHPA